MEKKCLKEWSNVYLSEYCDISNRHVTAHCNNLSTENYKNQTPHSYISVYRLHIETFLVIFYTNMGTDAPNIDIQPGVRRSLDNPFESTTDKV